MYAPIEFLDPNWFDAVWSYLPFMFGCGGESDAEKAERRERERREAEAVAAQQRAEEAGEAGEARQQQQQEQITFIPPLPTPPPPAGGLGPLEQRMNELAIRESELAIARLEAEARFSQQPQPGPIIAKINPEIQADIFSNIEGQINRETEDARRLILSDIATRNLTGSGIEQQALENLQERRERQLIEANRFAATESANLGLSTADLALRQQQAQQSARQFNVGIASSLENIAQQRAINRFGTLSGVRESALDRSLLAAQTRGSQALQQRGQDVSIFETLSQRAAENRKKKESLLGSLAGGIGSAIGTATGLGGGLAIGKRLGG